VNVANYCGQTGQDIPEPSDASAVKKLLVEMAEYDAEKEAKKSKAETEPTAKKKKAKTSTVEKKEKVVRATKKAKNGKAAKAAKGNGASTGKRGRKGSFEPTAKVAKVAKECPFREGSKAAKCFAQYKVGRTVDQIIEAGVPRAKLYRHMKRGVLTLA